MSQCFQSNSSLNLLSLEGILEHYLMILHTIKEDPLVGGHMILLDSILTDLNITEYFNKQ